MATSDLPTYLILNYGFVRERLSLLKQDGMVTLVFVTAVSACLAIRWACGMGLPGASAFIR